MISFQVHVNVIIFYDQSCSDDAALQWQGGWVLGDIVVYNSTVHSHPAVNLIQVIMLTQHFEHNAIRLKTINCRK